MKDLVQIQNLHVSVGDTAILNGIDLTIREGEVHAIMGPNGSGKSTLALTIMGHPKYAITDGSITFDTKDLLSLSVDERAKAGIFLAFQNPIEIEGVTIHEFLYHAYRAKYKGSITKFEKLLTESLELLEISSEFIYRHINVGLSGGEKKKIEVLQLAILQPKLVILDEIDSGLDVDALKTICNAIISLKEKNQNMSILIITHYPRILHYLVPSTETSLDTSPSAKLRGTLGTNGLDVKVHIMRKGVIAQSGTKELAQKIEKEGYSK